MTGRGSLVVTLFSVAFASLLGSAQAFIGSETIGNWFLNALTNFGMFILGGTKDAATSIYITTRNLTLGLMTDVFHSLSTGTTVFKDTAKETITELLNVGEGDKKHLPSSMQFLIGIMEAGPLPPEWYFIQANPETEVEHLKYWDSIMLCGILIYIMLSLILIICFGIIITRNRRVLRLLKKVQLKGGERIF